MKSAPAATTSTASATRPRGSTSTSAPAPDSRPPLGADPRELLAEAAHLIEVASRAIAPPAPTPGLHLSPVQIAQLERALGAAHALTATGLIHAVERLTALQIGDLSLPLTPGQLAELQHRARKRGRTVLEEMKAVVARLHDELFHQGG